MKKTLKIAAALVIASAIFAAGFAFHAFSLWYNSPVSVSIENQSGQSLKNLKLTFSSQISGNLIIPPPQDGKEILVKFFPSGEGSFTLETTLDSGKVIKYSAGYIEAGYSVHTVITNSELKNRP
jgi:hypothetical protein